jgi:hypothetical protein
MERSHKKEVHKSSCRAHVGRINPSKSARTKLALQSNIESVQARVTRQVNVHGEDHSSPQLSSGKILVPRQQQQFGRSSKSSLRKWYVTFLPS